MVVTKRFIWISIAVLVVLLGVLALGNLDYTISKAMISPDSIWANFFNMFGEMPAMLALLIGTAILYGSRRQEAKWRNITGHIVSLPFMLLFSFMVVIMPVRYYFEYVEKDIPALWMGIAALLAIALFIATLLIIKKLGAEKLRKARKVGLILLILPIGEMLLVNVVKIIWARPRMRSITSVDEFVHWYKINGPSTDEELKSFPSGHTANALVLLAYSVLLPFFEKIKKNWFVAVSVVWGVAVAASRVVLGAHFLSDVLVGGYITILLFFVIYKAILRDHPDSNQL